MTEQTNVGDACSPAICVDRDGDVGDFADHVIAEVDLDRRADDFNEGKEGGKVAYYRSGRR